MEVEQDGHSWHLISNVAIEIKGDKAEVESYGLTSGGEIVDGCIQDVNAYCGRYHDEFKKTPKGWKISRRKNERMDYLKKEKGFCFSSRRRHTRSSTISWARRCV